MTALAHGIEPLDSDDALIAAQRNHLDSTPELNDTKELLPKSFCCLSVRLFLFLKA